MFGPTGDAGLIVSVGCASDAPDEQEIAGSFPAWPGYILSCRLILNVFYGHSHSSANSRRAVAQSVSGE